MHKQTHVLVLSGEYKIIAIETLTVIEKVILYQNKRIVGV